MSRLLKVPEYAQRAGLGRAAAYESLRHLPAEAVVRIGSRIRVDWELARRALSDAERLANGTPSDDGTDT